MGWLDGLHDHKDEVIMPYIDQTARERLEFDFLPEPLTPGELNYVLAVIVDEYLVTRHSINYAAYNDVIGVLECLKQEIYLRCVALYEDSKRKQNGDVFTHLRRTNDTTNSP